MGIFVVVGVMGGVTTSGFNSGTFPNAIFERSAVALWLIKLLTTMYVLGSRVSDLVNGLPDSVAAEQLMLDITNCA